MVISEKSKHYLRFSAAGAAFVVSTNLVGAGISPLIKQSLGFSPLTLKNVVKVGVLSGATAGLLLFGEEKFELLTKIERMVG